MLKVNWKPLWPVSVTCTSTPASASSTTRGTVRGMMGPIITLNWTLLSIGRSRHTLRQGDLQHFSRRFHQLIGPNRSVRVANEPENQRISQILGSNEIQAVP